ncbi:MAG TPA: hypothetical protein VIU64_19350 [Polyangia bacterium]
MINAPATWDEERRTDRLFVATDELRFGWEQTFKNLKPWLWVCGAGALLSILENALTRERGNVGGRPLLALVLQGLQVAVTLASFRVALRVVDGRPAGDSDLKKLLAGYWPFLLTHVLFALIVAGGLLLLVIPGIVWAVTYGFAPMLCAAEGYRPAEALRESRRLTTGHRRSLLAFGLLCLGVNLLGALAVGLGLFLTVPTTVTAATRVLRRLQANAPRAS